MFMNFKNFANELDMYNSIVNATEERDYIATSTFNLDGYYVSFRDAESGDELLFALRATDDGCAIYLQSAKYGEQLICFGNDAVEFDEFVKLIGNFFYEAE